jgi:hypothetical protein
MILDSYTGLLNRRAKHLSLVRGIIDSLINKP